MRQIAYKTFGDLWGFNSSFRDTSYPMQPLWKEDEEEFTLEIILPGADKKDVKVERVDDKLIVSFEGNDYGGAFSYEYVASKRILKGERSAKYEKGVLTITITKVEDYKETIKVE